MPALAVGMVVARGRLRPFRKTPGAKLSGRQRRVQGRAPPKPFTIPAEAGIQALAEPVAHGVAELTRFRGIARDVWPPA